MSPAQPVESLTAIAAPSVWREGGYLILVYSKTERDVSFLSAAEGCGKTSSLNLFLRRITTPMPGINPHHLALNLLGRYRSGTFDLRVNEERKLVAMLSKEELLKLSERQLAVEYARVMGKGPQRIKSENAEKAVEEMMAKLQSDANQPGGAKGKEEEGPKKVRAAKEPKAPKAPKEKKEKEKKAKPAKEPKAPRTPKEPPKKIPAGTNPFRIGSMKAKCFDFFATNRDRAKCLEHMVKQGATESTAKSWYSSWLRMTASE